MEEMASVDEQLKLAARQIGSKADSASIELARRLGLKEKFKKMFKDEGIEWDSDLEWDWSRVSGWSHDWQMAWYRQTVFNHQPSHWYDDTDYDGAFPHGVGGYERY